MTTEKTTTAPDMTERKAPLPAEEMLKRLKTHSLGLGFAGHNGAELHIPASTCAELFPIMEQAIAVLETLGNPGFRRLVAPDGTAATLRMVIQPAPSQASLMEWHGANTLEAILGAHAELHPPTPPKVEQEEKPDGH